MKLKLFLSSFLLTFGILLAIVYISHLQRKQRDPKPLLGANGIFFTSQLEIRDLGRYERFGFKTIVDIRPDGEASDQPSSKEMSEVATLEKLHFHYIPVPHESIPATAVTELGQVLAQEEKPVVLYCRTGRRAVRLFALEEASRFGGPDSGAVEAMVKAAGFNADDLKQEITKRISERKSTPPKPAQTAASAASL